MHRDTMLKFGWLFYLAKYLEQHESFSVRGTGGASSPTLNFGTPCLSRQLIELGSLNLVRW